MRGILHEGARLAALFLFVAYAFSFAAPYFWFADLFRHFVFQYLIGAVILFVTLAAFRAKVGAAVMLVIALSCLFEIYRATPQAQPIEPHDQEFKALVYNRKYTLSDHKSFIKYIQQEMPDVIFLQEARISHSDAVKEIMDLYPFQIHEPRQNAFGMVLFSRHKIRDFEVVDTIRYRLNNFYIRATLEIEGEIEVVVYTMHPPPPIIPAAAMQRNEDIKNLSKAIANDTSENIIVAGDWNITPYSPHFKNFIRTTQMKNEYSSLLPVPTWPSFFPETLFQVPIDHILHKGDLELIEKRRGPHLGSDHYSLIATYALK